MSKRLKIIDFVLSGSNPVSFSSEDANFALIFVNSPASIDAHSGLISCKKGSFILKDSSSVLKVHALNQHKLDYSFLSFNGSDVSKIIRMSAIEMDFVYTPLHVHFADSILSGIESEFKNQNPEWQSIVCAYLLEIFSKIVRLSNHNLVDILPDHAQKLRDLRAEIHENFSKSWKIGEMASKMGLSTSRFASLYKNEFNISPTEDLIQTRIDQSKKMLADSKVSIKKVSVACGFESVHYFHRAFKKRANITPKHFQNKQFANNGSIYTSERHFSLDRLTQKAEYSGIIDFIDGEISFHGNKDHLTSLLGFSPQELTNTPFINFVAPRDRSLAEKGIKNILSNKNILDLSLTLLHKNGTEVPVEFSALLKGRNWFWFIKQENLQNA